MGELTNIDRRKYICEKISGSYNVCWLSIKTIAKAWAIEIYLLTN